MIVKVKLVKQWSDWGPGDIVELEAAKAGRVIAKGYGVAYKAKPRTVNFETATAPPAAETAEARPAIPAQTPASDTAQSPGGDAVPAPAVASAPTPAAAGSTVPAAEKGRRWRKATRKDGD